MGRHKYDTFRETNRLVGDKRMPVAEIECRECGAIDFVKLIQGTTRVAPVGLTKKFTGMGWEVGNNMQHHRCPECVTKAARARLFTPKEEPKTMKPNLSVVAPEPRVMQRDDRRLIFDKLNGVYIDEKRGYDTGWSDMRVAEDMGVPRAWVEQVREEMFGPVATNPEMEEFVKGVAELDHLKNTVSAAKANLDQMQDIGRKLTMLHETSTRLHKELAAGMDRITKLEKLAEQVKKHVVA